MQGDDLGVLVILSIAFFGFVLPTVSLPVVLWTKNSRYAKTFQWLAVFLVSGSFLGALTLTLAGAMLPGFEEYFIFALVLAFADLVALFGILTFKPESSASGLFLKIFSILFLLAFLIMAGWFIYGQTPYAHKDDYSTVPSATLYAYPTPTPTSTIDSWTAYTSTDVGYLIKYPTDWGLQVVDKTTDIYGQVKYIILKTPDSKYALTFGVKKIGAKFSTTDRTGVGNDKTTPEYNWSADLSSATIVPQALIYAGKTKEFMFTNNETTSEQCNCEFNIFYGPLNPTDAEYQALNLDPSVLEIPDKIISTFRWK